MPGVPNETSDNTNTINHVETMETDEPVIREITQTDKINKVLLNAFLDRFNKGELETFKDKQSDEDDEEQNFDEN